MTKSTPTRSELLPLLAGATIFVPLFAATYYAAFMLRFAGGPDAQYWYLLLSTLPLALGVKWIAFSSYRVYQGWTRYVSFHDLLVLGKAVTASSVGLTLIDALCLPQLQIPRSVVLIDWGMTLLVFGAARALPRLVRDNDWRLFAERTGVRSLIVGANDSGETLLRAIRSNPALNYRVVGFVDDRRSVRNRLIGGVPVVGGCDQVPRLVERHGVEEVLITAGDVPGTQVRRLVDAARQDGFRVKVLPSYEQLLEERVAVHPRPVAIEDLLCRPAVELDLDGLHDWLAGAW